MSDERLSISRRKTLAALGTIGAASAGAGFGTTAFFSDEETFKNNRLTAGSLDLKVDWEEHYSDWSDDEMVTVDNSQEGGYSGPGIVMSQPENGGDWNAMPDPQNPLIWVHDDALGQFMANTALEAYPDDGDNGSQSLHRYAEENYCDILADTPEDLDPNGDDPARTLNDDTVDENGNPKPLVSLEDVKPGDFGELTLSFHLCDNPGYVWLTGGLTSASENGVVEPEAKDADEESDTVELLDAIQTLLWYDEDGDNVYEPGGTGGPVDVVLALDSSGSMQDGDLDDSDKIAQAANAARTLVDELAGGPHQVGVVDWDNGGDPPAQTLQPLSGDLSTGGAVHSAIDTYENSAGGRTNLEGGSVWGIEELLGDDGFHPVATSPSGNDRDNADKILVLMSDGGANESLTNDPNDTGSESGPGQSTVGDLNGDGDSGDEGDQAIDVCNAAKSQGVRIFSIGLETSGTAEDTLEACASPGDFYSGVQGDELEDVFAQISQVISGEECFFRGSLRELLNLLSGNKEDGVPPSYDTPGIPLDGDRSTQYREVLGTPRRPNQGADPNRDPFVDSTQNYIGLAWYLPIDHGNEIQTDSAQFDLGFYTEQARHNDGSGMDGLVPTRRDSGWAKLELDFNGDGSIATSAHARRDDPVGNQALELRNTGDAVVAGPVSHDWQEDGTVEPFTYTHDGSDGAAFEVGGDSVSDDGGVNPPSDPSRIAIQTKADEATVSVENVSLTVGGSPVHTSGPTSVEAANDDAGGEDEDGRALEYLVFNTNNLDLSQGFEVSGEVSIDANDGIPSSPEVWAFDVVVE